jgi:hypothetical protein
MRWEYDTAVAIRPEALLQKIQSLAREGWELVSVLIGHDGQYLAYLKRELE